MKTSPLRPALRIVDPVLLAGLQKLDQPIERAVSSEQAQCVTDLLQALQAFVARAVPQQPLGARMCRLMDRN
jgi:hypothetical protein